MTTDDLDSYLTAFGEDVVLVNGTGTLRGIFNVETVETLFGETAINDHEYSVILKTSDVKGCDIRPSSLLMIDDIEYSVHRIMPEPPDGRFKKVVLKEL